MKNITIAHSKGGYKNTRIKNTELTIDQLFERLQTPDIRNNKDGKYFVFARFKEGTKRKAINLVEYYGAVLDIDDTTLSLSDVEDIFKGWVYALHTTHSHKEPGKGKRYRLVLPFAKPVKIDKYRKVIFYLMALLIILSGHR